MLQEKSLTQMIVDNIDFDMLITQDFSWINESTWTHLCYLIVLKSSKYFCMSVF